MRHALLLLFFAVSSFATEIVPSTAPHGARAVIVGTGLDGSDITVRFGATPATILFRSPALLEVVVPPAAISANVEIVRGATSIASLPFVVAADPAYVRVST